MDGAEQAKGERRVGRVLIEPLLKRGLARPTGLTKARFADMVADLCARLAYMSEANLMVLEEQVAGNPGGRDRDRFPIANHILSWAAQIQPPGDDASPLIRAVFANRLGLDALAGGWAPELLHELKQTRRWPGAWVVKTIRDKADGSVRRMRDLDAKLARGGVLALEEERWRSRRLSILVKCRRIAELGQLRGAGT